MVSYKSLYEKRDKALRLRRRRAIAVLRREFSGPAQELRKPVEPQVRPAQSEVRKTARILTAQNHDPAKQINLEKVVSLIVVLAQVMAEKKFYPYQIELSRRIVLSLLMHDGETLTCLMARQAGKSECVGGTCSACAVALPWLAKRFPDSWHLNITDDDGNYRGYGLGVKIGVYAPIAEQADITFDRISRCMETKSAKQVQREMGIKVEIANGCEYQTSSGSEIISRSASEQSKIEGATHHLLIVEEAQDVGDTKVRKSLHPMVASTRGTILKIGTASVRKCDFYTAIRENVRMEMTGGTRNHFFYPYTICQRYNSMYRAYIEQEKRRLGENSDEFQMSYNGKWVFERGMYVSQQVLLGPKVAMQAGTWSTLYPKGLPRSLRHFSLVAGVDWGSSSDSTVVTLVAVDWNSPIESGTDEEFGGDYVHYQKHLVGWIEFIGDNYEDQFETLCPMFPALGVSKLIMDSNACGRPIFDRYVKAYERTGIEVAEFNFSAKLKSDGYKMLSGDLHTGRITIPAAPEVRALLEYRKFLMQMLDLMKSYKAGLMCVAHPDERGAHDDYPDSLMVANYGAATPAVRGGGIQLSENPFFRRRN